MLLARASVLFLVALVLSMRINSSRPLACPDLTRPVLDLDDDAVPDPAKCFALPEIQQYLEDFRVALLERWDAPVSQRSRAIRILFSIDSEGAVER